MPSNRSHRRRLPTVLVGLLAATLACLLTAAPAVANPAGEPLAQLSMLDAEQAWEYATGDGVTVAVLDSGVDADHPALAGRVLPGFDFVDGSTDGRVDPVGHGTAVAALIAGRPGSNSEGLAPDAMILPVRVLDEQNRYREATTVADGIIWAVDQGAEVINLSLGGRRESASLGIAIAYAIANDVVVIACTGNGGARSYQEIWYPAREPGVVAVGGLEFVDGTPQLWPRSLTGRETVLAAPAVLTAAAPGGGTRQVQGTSFAAALVSAATALVRERFPRATAGEVIHRLVSTATDLGEPGRDPRFGFGAVDPVQALIAEAPPTSVNPLDTKTRHGRGGLGPAPELGAAARPTQSPIPQPAGQPAAGGAAEPPAAAVSGGGRAPGVVAGVTVAGSVGVLAVVTVVGLAVDLARRRGPRRV